MPEISSELYPFLRGGGEMGELTRSYDWSKTAIGAPDQWSQSQRALVNMMLTSRFPMLIFWGPELITFYNDAFRPSLGNNGKHPSSLGQRGEESWAESWPVIGPMIYNIMAGGEAVWFEDQKLPIYRDGDMGFAYWTYSFSPIMDDTGSVNGVLVTCSETTQAVLGTQRLQELEQRFRSMVNQAPVAMAVFRGPDHVIEIANEAYQQLVGRKADQLLGKPMFEAMPEIKGRGYEELLANVLASGQPYHALELSAPLLRNGKLETVYFNFTYNPLRDDDGSVSGVTVVANDISAQVLTRQKIEESEAELTFAINAAELGVWDLDPLTNRFKGNARLKDWFGLRPDEDIALPLALRSIADKDRQHVIDSIEQALQYESGGIYDTEYTIVHPQTGQERLVRAKGKARFGSDHTAQRLNGTLQDITEQKQAEESLRASEAKFRMLVSNAPYAITMYIGPELTIDTVNKAMLQIWGKDGSVVGKTFEQALPEMDGQPFPELLKNVYHSGVEYTATETPADLMIDGQLKRSWFNFRYKPLRNETGEVYGILHVAIDVSDQVVARRRAEESEARFRALIAQAPVATGLLVGRELVIEEVNEPMTKFWGKGPDVIGKTFAELLPELENQPFIKILDDVYTTGIAYHATADRCDLVIDGVLQTFYFNFSYQPIFNNQGEVYAILNMAIDVTPEILIQQQLRESEESLRGAIELAELGTWSVEVATGYVQLSQRYRYLLGLDEAQVSLEKLMSCVVEKDVAQVRKAFQDAQQPGLGGKFDSEHSIINITTGKRKVVHSLGQTHFDTTGKPVRIMGTVQDVTIQRELQVELENEVQERTEELAATNEELTATNEELAATNEELAATNEELTESTGLLIRSNENLQTFAYIASHDLQEPLRKIQQFGDLLKTQLADSEAEQLSYLERMQSAAGRMSMLIKDLLNFSRISTRRDTSKGVSLNEILDSVLTDLELVITETGAQIQIDPLPIVSGDPSQLGQLFQNLLSNALKFSRIDSSGNAQIPQISLRYQRTETYNLPLSVKPARLAAQYHHIDVIDNGIGFDEKYVDRIFQVFQRLHGRSEFAGTGIGLAICEKVVTNHGGAITATSKPGQGATFSVYLPA